MFLGPRSSAVNIRRLNYSIDHCIMYYNYLAVLQTAWERKQLDTRATGQANFLVLAIPE